MIDIQTFNIRDEISDAQSFDQALDFICGARDSDDFRVVIFKIEQVERDEDDQLWRVKMQATDEGTREIKKQIHAWKEKFQKGNLNLLFGRLLLDMHQYIKAMPTFK